VGVWLNGGGVNGKLASDYFLWFILECSEDKRMRQKRKETGYRERQCFLTNSVCGAIEWMDRSKNEFGFVGV